MLWDSVVKKKIRTSGNIRKTQETTDICNTGRSRISLNVINRPGIPLYPCTRHSITWGNTVCWKILHFHSLYIVWRPFYESSDFDSFNVKFWWLQCQLGGSESINNRLKILHSLIKTRTKKQWCRLHNKRHSSHQIPIQTNSMSLSEQLGHRIFQRTTP